MCVCVCVCVVCHYALKVLCIHAIVYVYSMYVLYVCVFISIFTYTVSEKNLFEMIILYVDFELYVFLNDTLIILLLMYSSSLVIFICTQVSFEVEISI